MLRSYLRTLMENKRKVEIFDSRELKMAQSKLETAFNNPSEQSKIAPEVPWFWIKDASGHKSVSVTLLVVSFFVTTIAFVLSIFHNIGPIEIRPFDVAACSTYMVPILTLYFSRRWTDARHGITQMREAAVSANTPLTSSYYDQTQDYSNNYSYSRQPYGPQPYDGIASGMSPDLSGFPMCDR